MYDENGNKYLDCINNVAQGKRETTFLLISTDGPKLHLCVHSCNGNLLAQFKLDKTDYGQ